jgi:hypothetical protein
MTYCRQCPRLNRRYARHSEGTTAAKKIMDEVLINVMNEVKLKIPVNQNKEVSPKNTEWTCPLCSVKIRQRQNIPRHKDLNCSSVKLKKLKPPKQHTPTKYKCKHCNAEYPHKKTLTAHKKTFHLEKYCMENKTSLFQCSKCEFRTIAEKYLKQHNSKFHVDKGSIPCEICDLKYSNKDSLRVHVKRAHLIAKPSTFICEVCGNEVSSAFNDHFCPSSDNSSIDQASSQSLPTPNWPPFQTNRSNKRDEMSKIDSSNRGLYGFNNNHVSENLDPDILTDQPSYVKSHVKFPSKLLTNAGGSSSLYRAAAQHAGLGQEGWQELRRYCHSKLLEWWQWYQPYYNFMHS